MLLCTDLLKQGENSRIMQSQETKPHSISFQISLYIEKLFLESVSSGLCAAHLFHFQCFANEQDYKKYLYIYSTHKVKARKNKDSVEVQLTELTYACCILVNKGFRLNGMNGSEASHGTFLILVPSQHLQSGQMDWVRFLRILGLLSVSVL